MDQKPDWPLRPVRQDRAARGARTGKVVGCGGRARRVKGRRQAVRLGAGCAALRVGRGVVRGGERESAAGALLRLLRARAGAAMRGGVSSVRQPPGGDQRRAASRQLGRRGVQAAQRRPCPPAAAHLLFRKGARRRPAALALRGKTAIRRIKRAKVPGLGQQTQLQALCARKRAGRRSRAAAQRERRTESSANPVSTPSRCRSNRRSLQLSCMLYATGVLLARGFECAQITGYCAYNASGTCLCGLEQTNERVKPDADSVVCCCSTWRRLGAAAAK